MSNEKSGKSSFIKDLIKDIIIAVVIVLAVTAVIKPTIVKESSMLDTLQENNYLFILFSVFHVIQPISPR